MPAPDLAATMLLYRYSQPGNLPRFSTSAPAHFTANAGTLYSSQAPLVPYVWGTPAVEVWLGTPNETRQVTVAAHDPADAAQTSLVLQNYATLLPRPDRGVEAEEEEPAVKTYAPDKKNFKVKYFGDPVERWNLQWIARRLAERVSVRTFRRFHRLHVPFYLDEQILGDLRIVCFDSGLKTTGGAANLIDFSTVVREYRTQVP